MTPGEREEIEKVVTFILITGENGGLDSPTLYAVCINKVTDLILTQVEKARREAIEECEQLVIDKNYGKKSDFSEAIRKKLEKE